MERQWRLWLEVGAWLAFQLFLTSIPGDALPREVMPRDWVAHAGVYAVLGLLVARAGHARGWGASRLVVAWGAIVLLAAADELHQMLVPHRDAAVEDWVADLCGAAAGLVLGTMVMRTRMARFLS